MEIKLYEHDALIFVS